MRSFAGIQHKPMEKNPGAQNMTTSIIIASRDRESYVHNLLKDLNKQTLLPDEIIVVDQSEEPYEGLSDIIHIKDTGNVGPCRARNLALEHCRGDILLFIDDDVRVEPDYVQTICNPILAGESLVVVGAMCDKDGVYPNKIYPRWKKGYKNWLLALTANPDYPGRCPTLSFTTACAAIHRSVYEKIGGFDPFFDPDGAGEDREYGLRIFHSGHSILFNGEAKVSHLGAPSGGRRSMVREDLSPLEKNSVYIVAKYFGEKVYANYEREWLMKLFFQYLTLYPVSWWRGYKDWKKGKRWVEKIRAIKKENQWGLR